MLDPEGWLSLGGDWPPLAAVDPGPSGILIGILIGGAVAGGLGLGMVRRLRRAMSSLAESALRIASQDTEERIEVTGTDEVAQAAGAFNAMADGLAARIDTITGERNKLRAILSGMSEGLIAVERDERVVHINEVAARILQVPVEGILGHPVWELVRVPEVNEALEECVRSMSPTRQEVTLPRRPTDRVVELHAAPLFDARGRRAGAVIVLNDVTQIRRLESMRRDFVANVSHELKTPLAAIKGLCETILDDQDGMPAEVQRRFLGKINGQAERLDNLVADLLILSRMDWEEGSGSSLEPCGLHQAIRESAMTIQPEAEKKGLEIRCRVPEDPVWVVANPDGLRMVADNLINNAVKYTAEGGTISVSLEVVGDRCLFAVEDTGVGIAPEFQSRVWERFYRVDRARSREVGGTGLGLAIVKNLIHRYGGEVILDSEPGRGSRFAVELPLAPGGEAVASEANTTPKAG